MGDNMAFEKVKYNNQYNKEHYARLNIQVPLAKKNEIENHWKSKGYKSLNAYVNDLIDKDMSNNPSISIGNVVNQTGDNNTVNIG